MPLRQFSRTASSATSERAGESESKPEVGQRCRMRLPLSRSQPWRRRHSAMSATAPRRHAASSGGRWRTCRGARGPGPPAGERLSARPRRRDAGGARLRPQGARGRRPRLRADCSDGRSALQSRARGIRSTSPLKGRVGASVALRRHRSARSLSFAGRLSTSVSQPSTIIERTSTSPVHAIGGDDAGALLGQQPGQDHRAARRRPHGGSPGASAASGPARMLATTRS